MQLVRRSPFLFSRDPFFATDRFFEDFFAPTRRAERSETQAVAPRFDIEEHEDRFVLTADLPGVAKADIQLSVDDGVLTLEASSGSTTESESEADSEATFLRRERPVRRYRRRLRLGESVDIEAIDAQHVDGVLTVRLPKRAPEVQQIQVR